MWQHYVNGLVGIWLIVSAYMFSVSSLQTDVVISGVVILILSIWGAVMLNSDRHMHTPSHA